MAGFTPASFSLPTLCMAFSGHCPHAQVHSLLRGVSETRQCRGLSRGHRDT